MGRGAGLHTSPHEGMDMCNAQVLPSTVLHMYAGSFVPKQPGVVPAATDHNTTQAAGCNCVWAAGAQRSDRSLGPTCRPPAAPAACPVGAWAPFG